MMPRFTSHPVVDAMCPNLQANEKELKELVLSHKLNIMERARVPGSSYAQQHQELDTEYQS